MKTKKLTKIFTSILLMVCMLLALLPVNFVLAEEPIPYTAPEIIRFYPTNPNILHIDISFPVEQNDNVYKLYVRAFYEYTVNGNVYRVDKYEASISAYDDETGVYENLIIQLAPNMGGLYDVYAVAGAIYSDGTIVETDPQKVPAGLLPRHDVEASNVVNSPIMVAAFVGTDDNGNPVYSGYEFGHGYGSVEDNPLANEDVEIENASITYHDNVLTLSGYFGDIDIKNPWTGYDVTKLVLDNAHFETLYTSTHKPLNIEVIGYSSGVIWFDNGTDILMTAAPGQPEMPTFSGPLISHGASGTDVSVAILSNIRYLAHSEDAKPDSWYRTIGLSAMAFDNCDVEITNTNNYRSAISTSDHTLSSSASLWTRINGSSLIVKDSDFRIYSDADAISIGNSYPYGLQDMLTADVVFDNSRAEILLGLTDKSSYTTAIYKSAVSAALDVKNGSSLKIYSNKTGGYTATTGFNTVHVDKTSEMLIDLKTPYNETLSGRYLMGITSTYDNSLIDIEGRLSISLENGYENLSYIQRGIRCNGTIHFHNGADVDIDVKGGKELYGIDVYGTGLINIDNANVAVTVLSNPTSTYRSYGINSITNTLSNANVKIDMQGGYCYNLDTSNLAINNTNLEIGVHRGSDTITKYSYFEPFYVSSYSSVTLEGSNTITVRVPKECYDYTKSKLDSYFNGMSYDLDKCICEPGSIHSECMKKAEEITPFARISAPQRDEDGISLIASWHRGAAETGKPIAVLYDEAGRMVSLQFLSDIEANDRTNVTFPLEGTELPGSCSVKLFLWEDFLKLSPLCGFEEVLFPPLSE